MTWSPLTADQDGRFDTLAGVSPEVRIHAKLRVGGFQEN